MATPKRQSAFFKATQEAQTQPHSETVEQDKGETVVPLHSSPVSQEGSATVAQVHSSTDRQPHNEADIPLSGGTARKDKKTSFYLTSEQIDKLDDLAYEHKKRTGQRINRNDIVRFLIDQCTVESLSQIRA